MKYIKKFEKVSGETELDMDYFEQCFIEFTDDAPENNNNYTDSGIERHISDYSGDTFWHIQIFLPNLKDDFSFEEFINNNERTLEVYKDIEVAINKVKIKYNDIKFIYKFTIDDKIYNEIGSAYTKIPRSKSIGIRFFVDEN